MHVNAHRLHLVLKMETWTQTTLLAPRHPLLLMFALVKLASERTGSLLDCPAAEAVRARGVRTRRGVRGEEAGPDHNTGEPPPSQSAWTNSPCPQTAPTDQSKPKLRVTTANTRTQMQNHVSLRRAGASTCNRRPRPLRTMSRGARQPRDLNTQKMLRTLQAAAAIVGGGGVLTDPSHTPPGPRTSTGTGEPRGAGEGPTTCTAEEAGPAGVMAGASNTRWWRERGGERRCYDKGQQEGQ